MQTINRYRIIIIGLIIISIIVSIGFYSCKEEFSPRPIGYFRINFPSKGFQNFSSECNFSFKYPNYTIIENSSVINAEPCWYNLDFPLFRARLHLSYKAVENNLELLLEDSYTLAMKHSIKADAINQRIINNPKKRVFGVLYDIKGNAASVSQFVLTDSLNHFFRGALYFNHSPNKDSIAPVRKFIEEDIDSLIESFAWE